MADLNVKDILELVMGLTKQSSNSLEPLVQIYSVRTLADMMRQQQPTPQQSNSSDFMSKMLEFAMAMKFFDMFEKKLGSGKEEDFMKMLQLFQAVQNSKADMQQLAQIMLQMQQMLNQSQEKNVELMKDLFLKKREEDEERWYEILKTIEEMRKKWDEEKIRMFENFEETLKRLTEKKAPFEEVRKFMEEYEEFRRLEQQLRDLIKGTELEKQPITDEKGNINIEKVLYYIDKWFFGGRGGLTSMIPPAKKEVKPPSFEQKVEQETPKKEYREPVIPESEVGNVGNIEVVEDTNIPNELPKSDDSGNTEGQE